MAGTRFSSRTDARSGKAARWRNVKRIESPRRRTYSEAGAMSRALLHDDLVPRRDEGLAAARRHRHAVLVVLYFLRNADDHPCTPASAPEDSGAGPRF